MHPGVNLTQFFNSPAMPIPDCQSQSYIATFDKGTVEFNFNSYGYRTHEFDKSLNDYILISGCSLTEGHGLSLNQTWGKKLESQLNKTVINLAKCGSNAEFVGQNLINWINSDFNKPQAVIVQWPDPYRLTHWSKSSAYFVLNQLSDDLYKTKLKQGEEHFYLPWIKSVIELDAKCKSVNIPLLHLCFQTPDVIDPVVEILKQYDINIHLDLKEPGSTWHFDNAALDGLHHSEWCTEQWAKRILTLLKNML